MRRRRTRYNRRRSEKHRTSVEYQRRKITRGLFFIFAVILLIIFIFGDHGVHQLYRLRTERAAIQKQIAEMRIDRENSLEESARLKTDMDYIERLARERYRMAKKGERVFKVLPKKESD
jgi:cell division protein FtsB